jgi:hypothetical protein
MLTVWDKGYCIGFTLDCGPAGFQAYDAENKLLGSFNSKDSAAHAVLNLSAAPVEGD